MALTSKETEASVQLAIGNIDREYQKKSYTLLTRAPLAKEVPQNGFILATVSGTNYIYVNIAGSLFKAALTAA